MNKNVYGRPDFVMHSKPFDEVVIRLFPTTEVAG
jgi:hypothetical protein